MAITFDFSTIDIFLTNIGTTIELFVEILALVFNNLAIFLLFCFFLGLMYAFIKVADGKRYMNEGAPRK